MREIEMRLDGAKWRIGLDWQRTAHMLNAWAKYPGGPVTAERLLGPGFRVLDDRFLGEQEAEGPTPHEEEMIAKAGGVIGQLSPDELERAYAEAKG